MSANGGKSLAAAFAVLALLQGWQIYALGDLRDRVGRVEGLMMRVDGRSSSTGRGGQ